MGQNKDADRGSEPAKNGEKGNAGDDPYGLRDLGKYLGSGMNLAVSTALFIALGWWLDGKFGLWPWATVICGVLGVAAGLYHFVKEALK